MQKFKSGELAQEGDTFEHPNLTILKHVWFKELTQESLSNRIKIHHGL